jgi:hypothetical protein
MVGPSGLEPPTSRLSGVRSNQLSYGPRSGGWEARRGREDSLPHPELPETDCVRDARSRGGGEQPRCGFSSKLQKRDTNSARTRKPGSLDLEAADAVRRSDPADGSP